MKPIFSEKINTFQAITLIEEDKIVNDDQTIAEILNEHFATITDNLGTMQYDAHNPVAMILLEKILRYMKIILA